ncbi:MAG: hypothetical protein QOF02_4173 [Blastocatellia bacterium]|jgi:hypothetical protein|nr:hypothetical protein [Blastocatellia bacterium]
MAQTFKEKVFRGRRARLWLCVALSVLCAACAATPPPDASGPRPGEPPYPIKLADNPERRQSTLASWERLLAEQGINAAAAPELQPVTAAVRSLPANSNLTLFLPKVGDAASQDKQAWEEATTESLRRFINSNARLFGAEPQQLSLVLLTDAADGTKKARYQQRPFRYPLANGFGQLEISFTNDRRILDINSTCIPEIEQLQRAGAGIRPRYSSDEVASRMQGRAITYTDNAGAAQSYTIQTNDSVTVHQLVIYPILNSDQPAVLDFHLAWEVFVNREPKRVVYLDAITDEILAVAPV